MKKQFAVLVLILINFINSQTLYERIFYPINYVESQYFGYYVIITDSFMFTGAHDDNISGNNSGSVYYYHKTDSNWGFIKRISPPDNKPWNRFGIPYLNGENLYVGAIGHNRGAVYCFNYVNKDWIETQKLEPDSFVYSSYYGTSIWEHNNQLFVGADADSRLMDASGAVYVYERMDGTWERKQKIYSPFMKEGSFFGGKVFISSKYNQLFVSAPQDSNAVGDYAGNVYVFIKQDSLWEFNQKLSPEIGEAFPLFGHSGVTKEDYLLIGAPGAGPTQSGGRVYIYKFKDGFWELDRQIISPINNRRDYFGYSLAIEGDYLLVGAPGSPREGVKTARAYLYKQTGEDFTLEHIFEPSDTNLYDSFGIGVAMNKGEYFIGAYRGRKDGYVTGRAYLFTPHQTSVKEEMETPRKFELCQNYPNPFNPVTTIKFSIPTSPQTPLLSKERGRGEVVTLKVFDVLGREVATLVNEEKAPGNYEVQFSAGSSGDASGLSSGIYFYRITAGKYSETKKMVLLR